MIMNNMRRDYIRRDFHKWCEENDYDIDTIQSACIFVYSCEVTDKAWEIWQAAYRDGYDQGCAEACGQGGE